MRRGPLYMMMAAAAFIAMVGFVKVARQELPAAEIIAWRGLIGVLLVGIWARRRGFRIKARKVMLARVLFGFGAMYCFYSAAKGLSVADLSLITKLQPMLVAMLAPLLLGSSERSAAGLWIALLVGLAGCGILLMPQLDVGLEFGLWAIGAACLAAIAHVCVRALGRSEDPVTVVFWFQVGLTILAMVTLVLQTGQIPTVPAARWWPYLMGCALTAAGGQLLMTRAYQLDPAPLVAAAAYTGPLWAVLADLVVFGVVPSAHALIGGVLIVGAGLWLVRAPLDPGEASEGRSVGIGPRMPG